MCDLAVMIGQPSGAENGIPEDCPGALDGTYTLLVEEAL